MEKVTSKAIEERTSQESAATWKVLIFCLLVGASMLPLVWKGLATFLEHGGTESLISLAISVVGLVACAWFFFSEAFKLSAAQIALKKADLVQQQLLAQKERLAALDEIYAQLSLKMYQPAEHNALLARICPGSDAFWVYTLQHGTWHLPEGLTEENKGPAAEIFQQLPGFIEAFSESGSYPLQLAETAYTLIPCWFEGQLLGICCWAGVAHQAPDELERFARLLAKYFQLKALNEEIDELKPSWAYFQELFVQGSSMMARFDLSPPLPAEDNAAKKIDHLLQFNFLALASNAFQEMFSLGRQNGSISLSNLLGSQAQNICRQLIEQEQLMIFLPEVAIPLGRNIRYFSLKVDGHLNQKGALTSIWTVWHEVTSIRTEKAFWEKLVTTAENQITLLDASNKVIFDSPSVRTELGYPGESRYMQNFLSYFHPEDYETLERLVDNVRKSGKAASFVGLRIRKHDRTWWITDGHIASMADFGQKEEVLIECRSARDRVRIEEEMERKITFFQSLVESTQEIITVLDAQGDIRYESPAMFRHFGYPAEKRIGKHGMEYFHPEDLPQVEKAFQRSLARPGEPHECTARFLSAKGTYRQLQLQFYNLTEKAPLQGVLMKAEDITEEVAAKKARLKSELTLHRLLEYNQQLMLLVNTKEEIVFVSQMATKLLGVAREKLIGRPLYKLAVAEGETLLRERTRQLLADPGQPVDFQVPLKRQDGSSITCQCHATAFSLEENTISLAFYFHDISEIEKREQQLNFRARFYHGLANNLSSLILFLDPDGNIKFANPQVQKTLGYKLKGKLENWIHSEEQPPLRSMLDVLAKFPQEEASTALSLMEKDGHWIKFSVAGVNALRNTTFKGFFLELVRLDDLILAAKTPAETALPSLVHHSASTLFFQIDRFGVLQHAVGPTMQLLEYSEEHLKGMHLIDLLHPDARHFLQNTLPALMAEKETHIRAEWQLKTASDTYRWVAVDLKKNSGSEGIGLLVKDIQKEKDAQQQLLLHKNQLELLFEKLAMPVAAMSLNGEITDQNMAFAQTFGKQSGYYWPGALPGQPWLGKWEQMLASCLEKGMATEELFIAEKHWQATLLLHQKAEILTLQLVDVSDFRREQLKLTELLQTAKQAAEMSAEQLLTAKNQLAKLDEALEGAGDSFSENIALQLSTFIYQGLLHPLEEIEKKNPQLLRDLEDMQELLFKYEEITPEVDLKDKLVEINLLKAEIGLTNLLPRFQELATKMCQEASHANRLLEQLSLLVALTSHPEEYADIEEVWTALKPLYEQRFPAVKWNINPSSSSSGKMPGAVAVQVFHGLLHRSLDAAKAQGVVTLEVARKKDKEVLLLSILANTATTVNWGSVATIGSPQCASTLLPIQKNLEKHQIAIEVMATANQIDFWLYL